MRLVSSAIFALTVLTVGAAQAAVSSVDVTLGPRLQAKAKALGQLDLDELAASLRSTVEGQLKRDGRLAKDAPDGDRIALVIEDAKPNRPTRGQLDATPGLSLRSLSIGGAEVSGVIITASGQRTPVHETWYEDSFRNERGQATTTWSDAEYVFDKVARDLSRQQDASR